MKEETEKIRGNYTPVRSSYLQRLLTRYAKCEQIHPNPEDEFCDPSVGPNYGIISRYTQEIVAGREEGVKKYFEEPLMVEKIAPSGYILLNGHHRWAAALRTGLLKIRVSIVNLTQKKDIYDMLANAKNTRRVAMDLDEVVFRAESGGLSEKPLRFPYNRIYRDPLRFGIPALFNFLNEHGYDIWVYTARYFSFDSLRRYFRLYHTNVCGVVTGIDRKTGEFAADRARLEKMISERYNYTLHIDGGSLIYINNRTGEFEDHRIEGTAAEWSRNVMDIIEKAGKKDETSR